MNDIDWSKAPVFGEPPTMECCVVRPSAYALIADDRGRLAVVRTGEGVFLPGGGVEPDETPERAAVREALEECGLVVRAGTWSCRAMQHVHSRIEWTHFEKRSTFLDATVENAMPGGREPDHALEWVEAETAAEILTDGSHRWAVAGWMRERTPPAR